MEKIPYFKYTEQYFREHIGEKTIHGHNIEDGVIYGNSPFKWTYYEYIAYHWCKFHLDFREFDHNTGLSHDWCYNGRYGNKHYTSNGNEWYVQEYEKGILKKLNVIERWKRYAKERIGTHEKYKPDSVGYYEAMEKFYS